MDGSCDNFEPAYQTSHPLNNYLVHCKKCNEPKFAHEPIPQALVDAILNPGPTSNIKERELPPRKPK